MSTLNAMLVTSQIAQGCLMSYLHLDDVF